MTTLVQLRNFSKEIADLSNSGFVSDSNWNFYANNAIRATFGILANLHEDYFLTNTSAAFVVDQREYTLPTDFWKVRGVDLLPSNNETQSFTTYEYNWEQRNRLKYLTIFAPPIYNAVHRYRVQGNVIRFEPVPSDSSTFYKLWYIQKPTDLSLDADTLPTAMELFLEYIATRTAYQALRKQEVDLSFISGNLQELKQEMEMAARMRQADMSKTVAVLENDYEGQGTDGYSYTYSWVKDV